MPKRITRRSVLATAGASVVAGSAVAAQRSRFVHAGGSSGSPPPGGNPFIQLPVTPGSGRTDSVAAGAQITVGPTSLTLRELGRLAIAGNTQTHTISIYGARNQPPITSVVVDTSGAPPGTFVYTPVSSTIVLWSGFTYYILSTEGTGDSWYDDNQTYTTTSDATLTNSCYFNTSANEILAGTGGANHSYVPVNFKYDLGAPGGITLSGSLWSAFPGDSVYTPLHDATSMVVTGTVTFTGNWVHGPVPDPGEVITYQWIVDGGIWKSPVLTDGPTAYSLPWTCDTVALGITDGTHVIYPRILDSTAKSIFERQTQGRSIVVKNTAFNNGTQVVPVVATSQNRGIPPRPDFVTYTGGNPYPTRNTSSIAYTNIPGASDPASPYHSKPALLRDQSNWYAEFWCGPRTVQYLGQPSFVTPPDGGGIYSVCIDPFSQNTTFASYLNIVFQNSMDGTRLNTWVSPYSSFVEDPAISGTWWGVEINGRVLTIDHAGTVTTFVGRKRNRSIPSYDPMYPGLTEAQIDTRITNLGNFPAGVDNLGGANDLCFDPRNWNIFYVACQVDNWIARVDISTRNITVYAGDPGAADSYTGDGGPAASATFAQPASIIMDATGIMYVADMNNSAIRKILPGAGTAAGNISTLCGGTTGPAFPGIPAMLAGTAYPVTSITWNSGTNTGHVLMPNPTTIELGWTLSLSGATNPGGSGDPNSVTNQAPRYVVTAWTNSQDFTVSFERQGFHPTIPTGPLGGSPVFTTIGSDIYSSPTPVSFAAAYVPIPGFMRFTSNGDIIVMEAVSDAIRRIYLSGGSAGTISRVGCFSNFLGQDGVGQFVQVDVDTTGMCGPVDDIFASKIQDAINAAHWTWRMSIDGSYSSTSFTDGWALPNYGPITEVIGGPGHYPWGTFLSKREARMIAVGSAQFQPVMIRQKLPGDPVVDHNFNINFNQAMIESGGQVHYLGSVVGFPREMRPSFYSLRGPTGGGFITNSPGQDTFEDLNATFPTDAGLAAFIQSGMGGMVPRPEIVGNQLRDYIYAIRRGTVAGSLGPTPTQPGPTDNNTTIPLILTCSAVRDSTTQITVTWTTDLPTLGMVAAWAPGQRALGTTPSLFSELESGFGTTHSMPCMVLAGVTPVHFVVVCETQHGIFAHTSDQTVT